VSIYFSKDESKLIPFEFVTPIITIKIIGIRVMKILSFLDDPQVDILVLRFFFKRFSEIIAPIITPIASNGLNNIKVKAGSLGRYGRC